MGLEQGQTFAKGEDSVSTKDENRTSNQVPSSSKLRNGSQSPSKLAKTSPVLKKKQGKPVQAPAALKKKNGEKNTNDENAQVPDHGADGSPLQKKPLPHINLRGGKIHPKNISKSSSVSNGGSSPVDTPGSPGKGLYLLKLAKSGHISGENPTKTLDYASRAAEIFKACSGDETTPSLELVMSLHIVAAAYCRMEKYLEAAEALEKTLTRLPAEEAGLEYSLAGFAGYMQLGDTYVKLGKQDKAVESYGKALRLQKQALGDMDPQVGETCRYLAEAYLQAMRFQEAEELCEHVLKIHAERSKPGSVEEAVDRRLMALILSGKGEHEAALEHLVLASTAMSSHKQEASVASIDASIGDCYVTVGRFDEAAFSYQKALSSFKHLKGEDHASVASIYVSLAELSLSTGKHRDTKSYAESALKIYGKQGAGHAPEELAAGLTDLAGIYEALNEREQALCLLQKALETMEKVPGEHRAAAGIQAQMGVLYYIMGKFSESHAAFATSVARLKSGAESKAPVLGILLNQMALALFELNKIRAAVEVLEEARDVLAETCGVHHPDTITVCSNLAGGYDALGRVDDAIDLLEKVVHSQEERLGTAHPDVVDERQRLEQMLKEVGRPLTRKTSTLEELLLLPAGTHSRRIHHKLVR